MTDALLRLRQEFSDELARLQQQGTAIESRLMTLEAQQFSTTTRLQGEASMVLGSSTGMGSAANQAPFPNRNPPPEPGDGQVFNAVSLNYDVRLKLDTSFSGRDLLRVEMRSGNFDNDSSTFAGEQRPTPLSELQVAFQQQAGADNINVVGIYKLYYQTPIGSGFNVAIGPRVGQQDVLPFWPTAYSGELLHQFNLIGAPFAYNQQLGAGGGLWWQKNGFAIGTYYISPDAQAGSPANGGIGTAENESIGGLQLGYAGQGWGVAAIYNYVMNDDDVVTATPYVIDQIDDFLGYTNAFGLSAYWQPKSSGWMPSISLGWGINGAVFRPGSGAQLLTSQSWMVGLEWNDVISPGNTLGMAVGQPLFATALAGGAIPNDGNYAWEWWYRWRITNAISLTPGLFYLSRPLGSGTPAGQTFSQLAGVLKLTFRF